MPDILGTDLMLSNWDLSVKDGDLELTSDVDCLKQDLTDAFLTPLFFWGMEIDFGSRLPEFVGGGEDPLYVADLRRAVNEVFEREPRVQQKDGWQTAIYWKSDGIDIECEFLPIESQTPESIKLVIDGRGN